MLDSKIEFAYIALCFDQPELWAIKFNPTDPLAQWLLACVDEYAEEFHQYPNRATFMEYIREECKPQQIQLIKNSLEIEFDEEFVFKKVITFVKQQNLKQAIAEATKCLALGEIEEAERILLKGTELIYTRTLDYFHDKREVTDIKCVSTGFSCLDKPLGGGLHLQNLGLIIGPKSAGKSLTMMNFLTNAVEAGERGLHISFEDSEDQIGERYDKRFKDKKKPKGELFVHVFPSGGATCSDCEALITAYSPKLVVVDYLNEMGWENQKVGKSEDFGERARGLKAISKRKNCGIWTAQQAGRGKKFADVDVTAEDAFWSYEPAQVADVVMTINQTKGEKEAKRIRYIIDRQKNGPDGLSFKFYIDYANMLLSETKEKQKSTRRLRRRKSVL